MWLADSDRVDMVFIRTSLGGYIYRRHGLDIIPTNKNRKNRKCIETIYHVNGAS